jgi:hypothetical protein
MRRPVWSGMQCAEVWSSREKINARELVWLEAARARRRHSNFLLRMALLPAVRFAGRPLLFSFACNYLVVHKAFSSAACGTCVPLVRVFALVEIAVHAGLPGIALFP